MKKHDWRNNYFHFGEWNGYQTCLMEWKCFNCGITKTIPDSKEKLITNDECKKIKLHSLNKKWFKKGRRR